LITFSWADNTAVIVKQGLGLRRIDVSQARDTSFLEGSAYASYEPTACNQGNTVVFGSVGRSGKMLASLWRIDAAGGNLTEVTSGKNDSNPVCSPDGKWVFYLGATGAGFVMRVPLGGGKAEKFGELGIFSGADYDGTLDISRDGKELAILSVVNGKWKAALIDAVSAKTLRILDVDPRLAPFTVHISSTYLHFSPDGKSIVYPIRENGVDNLWAQPLDGSPGRQITNFKSERIPIRTMPV